MSPSGDFRAAIYHLYVRRREFGLSACMCSLLDDGDAGDHLNTPPSPSGGSPQPWPHSPCLYLQFAGTGPAGWQTSRDTLPPRPTRQEHASRLLGATRDLISTLTCGVRRHNSSAVVGSEIKHGDKVGAWASQTNENPQDQISRVL